MIFMIYYYLIRIQFIKGKYPIIKDYRKNFLEVGELFTYLEKKHKDSYKLIFIKEIKYGRFF